MPIYEYNCPKCGDFELIRKFSDPPLSKCPTCRRKISKLISNTSFQLKGSGWYVTDYGKSGGSEKKSKEVKESSSETSSATETKSKDAKAA